MRCMSHPGIGFAEFDLPAIPHRRVRLRDKLCQSRTCSVNASHRPLTASSFRRLLGRARACMIEGRISVFRTC